MFIPKILVFICGVFWELAIVICLLLILVLTQQFIKVYLITSLYKSNFTINIGVKRCNTWNREWTPNRECSGIYASRRAVGNLRVWMRCSSACSVVVPARRASYHCPLSGSCRPTWAATSEPMKLQTQCLSNVLVRFSVPL